VGEKSDALEEFHPERMAGRILQMGDIVSSSRKRKPPSTKRSEKRPRKRSERGDGSERFTQQHAADQKMGPLEGILKMLPGVNTKAAQADESGPEAHEARRGHCAIDDA